jgi:hypothetical protein
MKTIQVLILVVLVLVFLPVLLVYALGALLFVFAGFLPIIEFVAYHPLLSLGFVLIVGGLGILASSSKSRF